jgi:hypothetical protein
LQRLTLTYRQISPDTYEITADWIQGIPNSDCGLLLSAQLTLAAGHRYFVAVGGDYSEVINESPPDMFAVEHGEVVDCSRASAEPLPLGCSMGTRSVTKTHTYRIDLLDEPLSQSEELAFARRRGLAYDAVFVYDAALVEHSLVDRGCPFDPP